MPTARLAYLADRQVHLVFDDGTEDAIVSPFVEGVQRREASIERKTAWKNRGAGARFMGAAALWDEGDGRRSPASFTSLAKGRRRGEILYAITTGPVSGLFAYDVETKEEQRLVHGTDGAALAIATSDDHRVIAMARDQKSGARNLAVMRDDGGDSALVTDGDTVDDAPSWVPVGPEVTEGRHQLVYQSTGIGRDAAGMVAGFGPTEINLLDAERGSLKTILSDPEHDYLAPRMTRDGTLYVMRRPYQGLTKPPDPAAYLKDGLLAPLRLAYAGFRYLDFFSMRYTGKPLANAGNAKARNVDARKLIERQNIAAAGEGEEDDAKMRRAPADWVLLRRRPDGDETVVAKSVVAFDVDAEGVVYVSDGDGVDCIGTDGRSERVSRAARVMALTATH
ncbi:MAG: hypothetical protein KF782_14070 [Labilithrix sp.]|nr:hypothetical protein [Labilithrix sp.]